MKNEYTRKYTVWVYPQKEIRNVIKDVFDRTVWTLKDYGFVEECDNWVAVDDLIAQKIGVRDNIPTYYKYWIIVMFEEYIYSQIVNSNIDERIKVSIASNAGQKVVITVSHKDFKEKLMFVHSENESYKSRVIDFEKGNEDD
jgi:hypothetical protein